MSLELYRKKRDFLKTPEPAGKTGRSGPRLQYVIHKHAARRLHYDFRLELDGTLKSWAVPKGPSLDPRDKRLAVEVEDHPLDYGRFEGVIPERQYGAGAVIVWDRGTWTPQGDARQGLREGELKFTLDGEKLKGGWKLVRMQGRAAGGKENWLLIKSKDESARPGKGSSMVDDEPRSVDSGRTLEDVASGRAAAEPRTPAARSRIKTARKGAAAGAKPSAQPKPGADKPLVAGVAISNPDRVVFEDDGVTKLDIARYYERMAAHILPYLKKRPVSLVRCPTGPRGECFFQKHPAERSIPGIEIATVEDSSGPAPYLVANTVEALIGLAQMGTIELHVWGAALPHIERPDTLVMDLDPDPDLAWTRVVEAARLMKAVFDELGLESFVKTTGGKGLHVVVPLARRNGWDEMKEFARAIATHVVATAPDRYTANMAKAGRKGKIFIDYLRNTRGATAVAPYSLRARPHATVAMPLRWSDLAGLDGPEAYTLRTLERGAGSLKNAWAGYAQVRQSLTARAKAALQALVQRGSAS